MSILIKGMEMPHDCRDCPMLLFHQSYGSTDCTAARKVLSNDWKAIPFDGRPDWCPLEELPPHGRLIDADEFYADVNESIFLTKAFKDVFNLEFDFQETVIEAEGGE